MWFIDLHNSLHTNAHETKTNQPTNQPNKQTKNLASIGKWKKFDSNERKVECGNELNKMCWNRTILNTVNVILKGLTNIASYKAGQLIVKIILIQGYLNLTVMHYCFLQETEAIEIYFRGRKQLWVQEKILYSR